MLGAIIGDIIGSRFEFRNTRNYKFELFNQECSYTDDTVCTLAIADAILTGTSYKDKLIQWCQSYPVVMGGYGASFNAWIRSKDHKPYYSFGNGSAMRVSPVAWAFDRLEDVKAEAEKTAIVTHDHPEGIKGAVAVAHAIWHFRFNKSVKDFIEVMNEYYSGFMDEDYPVGKFDETCQGTVPYCLQTIAWANSFEDAIRTAIAHGGDSDTIGAIVGSIAEARWGIPPYFHRIEPFLTLPMKIIIHNFVSTYIHQAKG